MFETKTLTAPTVAVDTQTMAQIGLFAMLAIVSSVVPLLVNSQWVVGPIVNAVLFVSTVLLGPSAALFLALIPSPIALVSGTLPVALAPMVPFIMLGNAVLVLAFHLAWRRTLGGAVALAAVLKFGFLFGTVLFVMTTLVPQQLHLALQTAMGMPQLITALLGGLLAVSVLKVLKKV